MWSSNRYGTKCRPGTDSDPIRGSAEEERSAERGGSLVLGGEVQLLRETSAFPYCSDRSATCVTDPMSPPMRPPHSNRCIDSMSPHINPLLPISNVLTGEQSAHSPSSREDTGKRGAGVVPGAR